MLEALAAGPLAAADLALDHGGLRRLADRGLVVLEQRAVRRRPTAAVVGAAAVTAPPLTPSQQAAAERIETAMATGEPAQLLLHGVTGSGKTEVYLRAAAAALDRGRGAIVLVPEIALTPQAVTRFQARFGDTVAILHSELGAGERYDEWRRLRRGEARVCVGPRSAVFAPVADLGLIVVDEEHDSSYKQEGDPRYDARRVAARRARRAGAVLVAGCATPRPESVKRLERLRLPERVDGRPLPPVEVLDMREAAHALHPRHPRRARPRAPAGEKAIVLLNRRGWSNFLSCRSCGRVWECPQCDVALVLHRRPTGRLPPLRPPRAGAAALPVLWVGVRRAPRRGHRAARARAGEALARCPSSGSTPIPRRPRRVAEVLRAFERAPAGVLLGTQMVAKGHDFPDVTLGVVLDADATLRFPDFRAEERTFALVAQLAGRAAAGRAAGGCWCRRSTPTRGDPPRRPHDADGFLAGELARREALRLSALRRARSGSCARAERARRRAGGGARGGARSRRRRAAVLGPAPLFRLHGRERAQLVVKARRPRRRAVARGGRRGRGGGGRHGAPPARRSAWTSTRSRIRPGSMAAMSEADPTPSSSRTRSRPRTTTARIPRRGAPRRGAPHVRKFGDPVLRTNARAVDRFDDALRAEIARMGQIMQDAIGVGLAAPQIGTSQRVLVYRVGPTRRSSPSSTPRSSGRARRPRSSRRAVSRCPACTSTWSGRSACACAPRTRAASGS